MVNRLTRDRAAAKPERPQRSTRFIYKQRSADQIKRRAESAGGRFDSIFKANYDVYRTKAGESAIRILPPTWTDHEHFGYDIWVHKYVGPDESNYLCLMKMKSKPCAWCDAAKEAKEAGDTDEFKKLSAKPDVIYWILDRDDENPMPQLWHVSGMADGEISDLGRSKRTGKTYYLDHPEQGWDILVDKKGAKLRTRYSYKRDADAGGPTPIVEKSKKQDEILQFITENPLPSVLKFYPNEYLEKLAAGGVHEQDEDLDREEPRPRRGKRQEEDEEIDEDKPRGGGRRRNEPEEDEDPPPDDDENGEGEGEGEGDEEERPRGRRGRARRDEDDESAGDDNGDEAYHEGEADEDESPRGRGRGGRGKPRDDDEGDEGGDDNGETEGEEDEEEKPRGRATSRRSRRTEEDEDNNGEEGEEGGEEANGEEDEGETRTTRSSSRRSTSRRQEAKPGRRVASRRR